MVFDGADRDALDRFGTVSTPTLSDLFVALMQRPTADPETALMKAFIALVRRELIEHRGAFLYAPDRACSALLLPSPIARLRVQPDRRCASAVNGGSSKFFELASGALWWFAYLMVALFFYLRRRLQRRPAQQLDAVLEVDAGQSDFKILMSKMLAALTILPAQILVLVAVTGLVLYGTIALATMAVPALTVPTPFEVFVASGQALWFCLVYVVLALLWYAPFFAWVGALSTVVGRWKIPVPAFLIPGLVVLAENLFVRGFSDFFVPESGVRGGFVLNYLRERATFSIEDHQMFKRAFTENEPLYVALGLLNNFVAQIDWVQMGSGLIVAALLVYVASEYRRRVTLT